MQSPSGVQPGNVPLQEQNNVIGNPVSKATKEQAVLNFIGIDFRMFLKLLLLVASSLIYVMHV